MNNVITDGTRWNLVRDKGWFASDLRIQSTLLQEIANTLQAINRTLCTFGHDLSAIRRQTNRIPTRRRRRIRSA